jgi:hypothetical protein
VTVFFIHEQPRSDMHTCTTKAKIFRKNVGVLSDSTCHFKGVPHSVYNIKAGKKLKTILLEVLTL